MCSSRKEVKWSRYIFVKPFGASADVIVSASKQGAADQPPGQNCSLGVNVLNIAFYCAKFFVAIKMSTLKNYVHIMNMKGPISPCKI